MARRARIVVAVLLLGSVLSACQVARVGARCSGGFARSATHVLTCQAGRWRNSMTIEEFLLLAAANHSPESAWGASAGLYRLQIDGWSHDPDGGSVEIVVTDRHRLSNSTATHVLLADGSRPDVAAARGGDGRVGFAIDLAAPAGEHSVCAMARNRAGTAGADVDLGCRTVDVRSDAPGDPLASGAGWLQTVNHYRTASDLAPVVDEPAWSDGIVKHLAYLRNTDTSLMTGSYQSAHSENPASPWYTPEGAAAGGSSNLGGGSTERDAIEGWMAAPYHAIGILRPGLTRSAFGSAASPGYSQAGLDVIRGLGAEPTGVRPVVFPGRDAVIHLRAYSGGEIPNPLTSCGYSGFVGLPLIVMLPTGTPTTSVSARLSLPWGPTVNSGPDLCVVTGRNDVNGSGRLDSESAVLVIPKTRLTAGRHTATVDVVGYGSVTWSFWVTDCTPGDALAGCPNWYDPL